MYKLSILIFFFLIQFNHAAAHVGSPDVVMEGMAGPYRVLVNVQPPDVIPGVAKVKVFIQNGAVSSASLRPIYFKAGDEGAPPPEEMNQVKGQRLQYIGETWLMSSGSSSVQINLSGVLGKGEIIVPVVAMSTAKKEMPASTGRMLAGLGIFLFVLIVTIIGASVSDALTRKGELVVRRRKKLQWISMSIAAMLTSLIVYGGNAWWESWANKYRKFMFVATTASTKINANGSNELTFSLDTTSQRRSSFSYMIPDHGKMMHMFVMRIPAMDAFAHLHPQRIDSANFRTILPGLPKGRYLAFADIVYNSGYTETIKDTFNIDVNLSDIRKLDPDDAFAYAIPSDLVDNPQTADPENTIICGKPGTGVKMRDGSTMQWQGVTNKPLEAGQLYSLKFAVFAPDSQPAKLDHYLGMAGHAAIVRSDGNVYIHLHPIGTYSMAAETNIVKRIADPQGVYQYPDAKRFSDSINQYVENLSSLDEASRDKILMQQMVMPLTETAMQGVVHTNTVEFPYSFPTPGKYRIWVQVKRNQEILTAAFDKIVE